MYIYSEIDKIKPIFEFLVTNVKNLISESRNIFVIFF